MQPTRPGSGSLCSFFQTDFSYRAGRGRTGLTRHACSLTARNKRPPRGTAPYAKPAHPGQAKKGRLILECVDLRILEFVVAAWSEM
jgi:hypothetical protein